MSVLDKVREKLDAAKTDPQRAVEVQQAQKAKEAESLPCSDWREVINDWRVALDLQGRQDIPDVLAAMLALALSTRQKGDQLFLRVIADAGSAKTRLCDAMLVSKACYPLEHLTGFHSGWKVGDGEEDYSLLARINNKLLITPEGDVLMSSPRFVEIMSQQRRIFDGTSGASFKNRKEDMRYTGLRTPWIMAGTPALLEGNEVRLGDRFLTIKIDKPTEEQKQRILRRVGYTALDETLEISNGDVEGQLEARMLQAYRRTGGYVDFLQSDPSGLLRAVTMDRDWVVESCAALAEFTADLRARPHPDPKRDHEPTKELPSRLGKQYNRLALCLGATLGKFRVDEDCMRVVSKVAVDTSHGRTLQIAQCLYKNGRVNGASARRVSFDIGFGEDRAERWLVFLSKIGVTELFKCKVGGTEYNRWRLTRRMHDLCSRVGRVGGFA